MLLDRKAKESETRAAPVPVPADVVTGDEVNRIRVFAGVSSWPIAPQARAPVAVPLNAPGLKLYPRRAFAAATMSSFDYPLSSRFDESDSFCVFDNVFVPWENVFVHRNLAISRDQWWKTPAHLYGNHQAQCRYATKLRFMMGLAKRMNEMTGNDAHPAVNVEMGGLAALPTLVDSMLQAHEVTATIDANGVLWPSRTTLYSVMSMQSEINGRMLEIIRELAGAAVITLPSSARDFDNPEMAQDISRCMQSASADAIRALPRCA